MYPSYSSRFWAKIIIMTFLISCGGFVLTLILMLYIGTAQNWIGGYIGAVVGAFIPTYFIVRIEYKPEDYKREMAYEQGELPESEEH